MVQCETGRFGTLEVPKQAVLRIGGGLIGFPERELYAVLEHSNTSPLRWLQSLEDPDLAFVVADPRELFQGYQANIDQADLEALGWPDTPEMVFLAILTVPDNITEMTANLLAPVAINGKTNVGKQCILLQDEYSVRHPVFELSDD